MLAQLSTEEMLSRNNPSRTMVALFEFLRAQGMKSVKCGCETTNCGLCTVHLNGKPVLSCSQLAARCAGSEVVTLEGVQEEAKLLDRCLACLLYTSRCV